MTPAQAREILTSVGWLSRQPPAFQDAVMERANLVRLSKGDVLFRPGDPPGGIYGLVTGSLMVMMSPTQETPRLMHVSNPGAWLGEGGFLGRAKRRLMLQAAGECWLMHLPLEAMEQMAQRDPLPVTRCFVGILMENLDVLMHALHELQSLSEERRIASALLRVTEMQPEQVNISQADLGVMTGTSRKTVNAALGRFAEKGWLRVGYRVIEVVERDELQQFVESDI